LSKLPRATACPRKIPNAHGRQGIIFALFAIGFGVDMTMRLSAHEG